MTEPTTLQYEGCFARLEGDRLTVENALFARTWQLTDAGLAPVSWIDRRANRNWLARQEQAPCPSGPEGPGPVQQVRLESDATPPSPVEQPSLRVVVGWRSGKRNCSLQLQIFPKLAGVRMRLTAPAAAKADSRDGSTAGGPSGVELAEQQGPAFGLADCLERFDLAGTHLKLIHPRLGDRTDIRDELSLVDEYLLHPNDAMLRLSGCLFAIEDPLTGQGLVLLKESPLPDVNPAGVEADLLVSGTGMCFYDPSGRPYGPQHPLYPLSVRIGLYGHGITPETPAGQAWSTLSYTGGRRGRTEAIQSLLRCLRRAQPGLDGIFLTNTWGDRNRDGRICESFLTEEIRTAAKLGADLVQIDDGWQKGTTSNSVNAAAGGVWEGFYAADADFWTPHPQRLPNGLEPLVELGQELGVDLGLWFAPDSSDDFAQYRTDAEILIGLHRRYGVKHFKIDGINIRSAVGLERMHAMFEAVLRGTEGKVAFDLDATAQRRGGYFGFIQAGPIFLENRYTDFHKYWPHHTLRNLWQLAEWVDPTRLQIEWLNPARWTDLYRDDPLAPSAWPIESLLATTLMASPLGWLECSGLDEQVVRRVARLAALWKEHRRDMQAGTILPLGHVPDGTGWTGFVSYTGPESGYLLLFRQLGPQRETLDLPGLDGDATCQVLFGDGSCAIQNGRASVLLDRPLGCIWVRFG
ncbi:MAG: hypothetical protein ACOCZE_01495 [Planctomycetota bacterium]